MQLNVYVPNDKAGLIEALDEASRRTGRPKNEIVLEALEAHLGRMRPELEVFHLGAVQLPRRSELHLERWNR